MFYAWNRDVNVLGGVGLVVHEEQLDVLDVADKEGLVARGHHVAGLLVGAIADLKKKKKRIMLVMPLVRVQVAVVSFVSHVLVPNPPSSRLCAAEAPFLKQNKTV